MKKIYVATKNEMKIGLARKVFAGILSDDGVDVRGCDVSSDVSSTPQEDQTFQGAKNRAVNSKEKFPGGDYYIGLETGLVNRHGIYFEETWCCVLDQNGNEFWGYSSGNVIPADVKTRFSKELNVLEVYNPVSDSWSQYSGRPEVRERELENAIRASVIQLI